MRRGAEVFVGDFDDEATIRVYAKENATQRGNHSAAVAGSVLAAVHFLATDLLTGAKYVRTHGGGGSGVITPTPLSDDEILALIAQFLNPKQGIGRRLIAHFLDGVPGINEEIVRAQLANLKASGDYARVIELVHQELVTAALNRLLGRQFLRCRGDGNSIATIEFFSRNRGGGKSSPREDLIRGGRGDENCILRTQFISAQSRCRHDVWPPRPDVADGGNPTAAVEFIFAWRRRC